MGGGEGGGGGLLSYKTLVHACAGATAGCAAMLAFFPLDTVRARRQVGAAPEGHALAAAAAIARREGHGALYRGCVPLLQALCASNFVYFYAFHGLKAARARGTLQGRRGASAGSDLALAAAAGALNVLLTNPLWVVVTRLRLARGERPSEGPAALALAKGLRAQARKEGVAALWAGTAPSLLLVSNPALQFMAYEALKRRALRGRARAPSPLAAFALGAAAKAFATVLTYPLQLLQTRMRRGQGLWDALRAVLEEDGAKGLFKGLEAKLLQTVLTAALMFTLYERIAAFVFAVLMAHKRGASLAQ